MKREAERAEQAAAPLKKLLKLLKRSCSKRRRIRKMRCFMAKTRKIPLRKSVVSGEVIDKRDLLALRTKKVRFY